MLCDFNWVFYYYLRHRPHRKYARSIVKWPLKDMRGGDDINNKDDFDTNKKMDSKECFFRFGYVWWDLASNIYKIRNVIKYSKHK